MSDYIPKVGDVVALRDRVLDAWDTHQRGYAAYVVLKVSPSGQRVTIQPRGRQEAKTTVLAGGQVRALVPMTAEIEAEMRLDDAWLTARRRAGILEDELRAWRQERKSPEDVDRFLNAVEGLKAVLGVEP